jgi:hypothetical protein
LIYWTKENVWTKIGQGFDHQIPYGKFQYFTVISLGSYLGVLGSATAAATYNQLISLSGG